MRGLRQLVGCFVVVSVLALSTAASATTQFDADQAAGDAISRAFSSPGSPFSSTGNIDTSGLVAKVQTSDATPVAEPDGLALLGSGLITLARRWHRRRYLATR